MNLRVLALLVSLACLGGAVRTSATPAKISACLDDLMMAMFDMAIPDEVLEMSERVKELLPGRALVQVEREEIAGKIQAPEDCKSYSEAIEALLKFDSCERLLNKDSSASKFWAQVIEGSTLDRFLGASKCCVHLMG